jgi:hypothetical protein
VGQFYRDRANQIGVLAECPCNRKVCLIWAVDAMANILVDRPRRLQYNLTRGARFIADQSGKTGGLVRWTTSTERVASGATRAMCPLATAGGGSRSVATESLSTQRRGVVPVLKGGGPWKVT